MGIIISGRMLLIMSYLEGRSESNYKEISQELKMEERKIRYDIDNINDLLQNKKKDPIVIKKGILFIPNSFQADDLRNDRDYVYSLTERVSIMRCIALFHTESLNLEKLCRLFSVSRSTIKKDLTLLDEELNRNKITIAYQKKFRIEGSKEDIYQKRVSTIRNYVGLIGANLDDLSTFEHSIIDILQDAFQDISIEDIASWSKDLLNQMGWVLNDDSFSWYLSNVLVFVLLILQEEKHPLEENISILDGMNNNIKCIHDFETIVKRKLSKKQAEVLISFSLFTNKFASLNENMDLMTTERLTNELIRNMSEELNVNFRQDMILYKGLLNHIAPLIERVTKEIQLFEDELSIMPEKYDFVLEAINKSIKKIYLLERISNQNEKILLAIHFLGSLDRNKSNMYKNVLLVCGLGYGAIALVKDKLINDYQVKVIESIPLYKIEEYKNWENIDLVISTSPIMANKLPKPVVFLNPVFRDEEFTKLEDYGVKRKNVLSNFYSISKKLSFLEDNMKEKVLAIIKEELGYHNVRFPLKQLTLSDLIGIDSIEIVEDPLEWEVALRKSSNLLAANGLVESAYADNIISIIKDMGFYSVKDEEFALFHGNDSSLVNMSGISLLICKESIDFGEKKAKLILCLASRDKKEQIPAIINLTKMVYRTNLIEELETAETKEEALKLIYTYEKEVTYESDR